MLAEALTWLVTPASWTARRMGHLAESIAITARHRRCRQSWAPHLAASRAALLDAAERCPQRRVALLLGSGPLLDVPLAELSQLFEEVWLADVVHPLAARRQARRLENVRLIDHDVTECLTAFPRRPPRPARFLSEPRIDWVASVNLLSQLANLPRTILGTPYLTRRVKYGVPRIQLYSDCLMKNHLDYLLRFDRPVCLLSDVEQFVYNRENALIERRDFRRFFAGWQLTAEWMWILAPPGELPAGRTARHHVAAFANGCSCQGPGKPGTEPCPAFLSPST